MGSEVVTSYGNGRLISLNVSERLAKVQIFELKKVMDLPLDDVVEQH